MEFLFVPISSELKQEITLYRSLELDQSVRSSRNDFVGYIDSPVNENAVDNLVLLKRSEQN